MKNIISRLIELKGAQNTAAFARSVGLNQQTMDRYIKGREPPIGVIKQICTVYGVSADWLLGLPEQSDTNISASGSGAIAIGGGNAVSRDCMECPLLQAHLKRFSKPPA